MVIPQYCLSIKPIVVILGLIGTDLVRPATQLVDACSVDELSRKPQLLCEIRPTSAESSGGAPQWTSRPGTSSAFPELLRSILQAWSPSCVPLPPTSSKHEPRSSQRATPTS